MQLLFYAGLAGQLVSVLRQELDSMIKVIYLLAQPPDRQKLLIATLLSGNIWSQQKSKAKVTEKEMVDSAQLFLGWTQSVYKFDCAFIHLSHLHDYNDSNPFKNLSAKERDDIHKHCQNYHGGPNSDEPTFSDFVPYFPDILKNNWQSGMLH